MRLELCRSSVDATPPGPIAVALLPGDESLGVYCDATPEPELGEFRQLLSRQLVATFKLTPGTQTGSGSLALLQIGGLRRDVACSGFERTTSDSQSED